MKLSRKGSGKAMLPKGKMAPPSKKAQPKPKMTPAGQGLAAPMAQGGISSNLPGFS